MGDTNENFPTVTHPNITTLSVSGSSISIILFLQHVKLPALSKLVLHDTETNNDAPQEDDALIILTLIGYSRCSLTSLSLLDIPATDNRLAYLL
ncbi:hypothetical protein FA15DRAFT_665141 [Coprinopsis marcescibilis]|uniref:F-box domain-containing protein n=1 Tax=Coprinopsis marcescibilis TaxID=230819 RepID=A0A5C3LJD4_COPMA|nr:hypothetical protein FA15DRAFT_665141 [Coprinopsis marcescibilis]